MTRAAQSALWDPLAGPTRQPRAALPLRCGAAALMVAAIACAAWSKEDAPAAASDPNRATSRTIALLRADDPLPATRETRASLPIAESLEPAGPELERATGL
jgi:hypothetical protein